MARFWLERFIPLQWINCFFTVRPLFSVYCCGICLWRLTVSFFGSTLHHHYLKGLRLFPAYPWLRLDVISVLKHSSFYFSLDFAFLLANTCNVKAGSLRKGALFRGCLLLLSFTSSGWFFLRTRRTMISLTAIRKTSKETDKETGPA